MDVPLAGTWSAEDAAFWTGTRTYQPWKDVAVFFRGTKPDGAVTRRDTHAEATRAAKGICAEWSGRD